MKWIIVISFQWVSLLGLMAQQAENNVPIKAEALQNTPAPEAFWVFLLDEAEPGRVIFSDLSLYHPDRWRWHFGDGGNSSYDDPEYTYTQNGKFLACLTVSNPSGMDTACDTIVITGLVSSTTDRQANDRIILSPNPSDGYFYLSSNDVAPLGAELVSMNGSLIRRIPLRELSGRVDISDISPGIYFIVTTHREGISTERLVVH